MAGPPARRRYRPDRRWRGAVVCLPRAAQRAACQGAQAAAMLSSAWGGDNHNSAVIMLPAAPDYRARPAAAPRRLQFCQLPVSPCRPGGRVWFRRRRLSGPAFPAGMGGRRRGDFLLAAGR